MKFTDTVDYLQKLHTRGICPGLSRIEEALAKIGDVHRRFPTVHVAGTNGKGSTAEMIRSIATAAGYKTGLYTSPSVVSPTDVMQIDGTPIDDTVFADYVCRLAAYDLPLTEFEFLTVIAFWWFADSGVSLAVVECGLGGKEDATNVLPPPLCAVFTPVSLDHTALLGDTIGEIAAQKAGIIKPPCAVVSAPDQSPEALAVLMASAASNGLTVRVPGRGIPLPPLSMTGEHQRQNAYTACEVAAVLTEKGFAIDERAIAAGLQAARLPCRQEWIDDTLLLDGGHNPAAAEALANLLRPRAAHTPLLLLTGMLADKAVAEVAAVFRPLFAEVICCTPAHPDRALAADKLAEHYQNATVIPNVLEALAYAQDRAKARGGTLVVAGSFYVASVVRKAVIS